MEKENIFLEEKKNKEGKGGKYLENKNIFFFQKRRNTEKEKAKYIWKRKIFFAKRDKEKEEIFRERKYHLLQRRGTMEKEKKENTF